MVYILKVKIKSVNRKKPLPDFGLGEGVLATGEIEIPNELPEEGQQSLINLYYQQLLNETVEPKFEIKRTKENIENLHKNYKKNTRK